MWNAAKAAIAAVSDRDLSAVQDRHAETQLGRFRYRTIPCGLVAAIELEYAKDAMWRPEPETDGDGRPACWVEVCISSSGGPERLGVHAAFTEIFSRWLAVEHVTWSWQWSGDSFASTHMGLDDLEQFVPHWN